MSQTVPGVRGIQHVGVTVPDLDHAIRFFESVLGARTLLREGPVDADDAWMVGALGAEPDSRLTGLAMMRVGAGTNLEVLEYQRADGLGEPAKASAHSASHVAFEVDDLSAAVSVLQLQGVEMLAGPGHVTEGSLAGLRWIYFRAPWGLVVELIGLPEGLGYMRRTTKRLWDPKNPAA